jgi:hypothetical protein
MTTTPPAPPAIARSAQPTGMAVHGNAYAFLTLVLTVTSLVIMVPLLLPIDPALQGVLTFWDNLICVVFLVDFGWNVWPACEGI